MNNSNEKYFLFTLLAIVIVLVFAVFYPFINVLILAGSFSVLLSPLYKYLNKNITKNISWLSALICTAIFFICLCVPIFFIGKTVFHQAQDLFTSLSNPDNTNLILKKIDINIKNFMPEGFTFDIQDKIREFANSLTSNISSFFASTIHVVLMFVLMILSIFYILKNGSMWKKNIIELSPLSNKNMEEIISNMTSAVNQILKGTFFIALIQGILASFGFILFGIPNPILWGIVTGFTSLIPTLGTGIIAIPAIIFLYITGHTGNALGLLIWSVLLVGMIDNILSPYIISKNTKISSIFILFSILGGISLMGPIGILAGPLLLSLLYSLVAIYKKESRIE